MLRGTDGASTKEASCMARASRSPNSQPTRSGSHHSERSVRQFDDLFATPTGEALATVDSMAAALSVSRCGLFKAFRQWPGMAPARYLPLIGLYQLRASLIDTDPENNTVTHLASVHGFTPVRSPLRNLSRNIRRIAQQDPQAGTASLRVTRGAILASHSPAVAYDRSS